MWKKTGVAHAVDSQASISRCPEVPGGSRKAKQIAVSGMKPVRKEKLREKNFD